MRSATAARLQSRAMVLNAIWVAFILVGFAVALVKLFQGDVLVFSKILTGLFDLTPAEAKVARGQGVPTLRLARHHLAMMTHADEVASALVNLVRGDHG